ncbi:MAG: hypothetical protein HRF43_06330, partial [Phycisphaerae bacterium]
MPIVRAGEGDPTFSELPYAAGFDPAQASGGPDPLQARLAYVVERMGTLATADGRTLLPAGTTFDELTFAPNGEPTVFLTLGPGGAAFGPSESHAGAIDQVIADLMGEAGPLPGLNIRLRTAGGEYRSLGDFLVQPAYAPEPEPARVQPPQPDTEPQTLGGPLANAAGQPAGALSGVVIFCNAGHGFSAGSSSWSLDRPLLFSMNEDYGNLEQLNYFVQYAYNAGATVVPFRPVGYQPVEIVLDNDDPGVTYSGTWSNATDTPKYYENGATSSGIRYRYATAGPNATAVARFTPNIPTPDFYPVYCWTPVPSERSPVTQTYRIT